MNLFLTALMLLSCALANPADQGLSLMYQGKNDAALEVLEPLAHQKNAKAAFYASVILLVEDHPNPEKGLPYLRQAVDAGYGPALDTYAGLYLKGVFVPKDVHTAIMYYEVAATRGYGPSQFNYGIMCKNGDGVPIDLEAAYVFLSLAGENKADLGDVTGDAIQFRDEVKSKLSPEQFARAHNRFQNLEKQIRSKKIDND